MKKYKAVSGPTNISVKMGNTQQAFNYFADVINKEAVNGWEYHSMETITVTESGCFGRANASSNYYMLIFVKDMDGVVTETKKEQAKVAAPVAEKKEQAVPTTTPVAETKKVPTTTPVAETKSNLVGILDEKYKNGNLNACTIPSNVNCIGKMAFAYCPLQTATFENINGWYVIDDNGKRVNIAQRDLADKELAAKYLRHTYCEYRWYREE